MEKSHPLLEPKTWYSKDDKYAITVDRSGSWSVMDMTIHKTIDSHFIPYKAKFRRSPRQMARTARHILVKKGIEPTDALTEEAE